MTIKMAESPQWLPAMRPHNLMFCGPIVVTRWEGGGECRVVVGRRIEVLMGAWLMDVWLSDVNVKLVY